MTAPVAAAQHDVVGDHVERLLLLALHVDVAGDRADEPAGPPGAWPPSASAKATTARDALAMYLQAVWMSLTQRDQLGAGSASRRCSSMMNFDSVLP